MLAAEVDYAYFVPIMLCSLAALLLLFLLDIVRPGRQERKMVGRVKEIRIYPVKSCGRISVQELECTHTGLHTGGIYDRMLAVMNEENCIVGGRDLPKLVLVQVSLQDNQITMDADGMDSLTVSLDTLDRSNMIDSKVKDKTGLETYNSKVLDCGDTAADWISGFLQKPGMRLVARPPNMDKRTIVSKKILPFFKYMKEQEVTFSDVSHLALVSEESLSDLNSRLATPVSMEQLRYNIVVSGAKGYDEDMWEEIHLGSAKFSNFWPCPRCVSSTIDTETGKRDKHAEPLVTLRKYRMKPVIEVAGPCLGVVITVDTPGSIRVGDPVYAIRGGHSTWYTKGMVFSNWAIPPFVLRALKPFIKA